jgi:SHS2 domain-containing protein
MKNYELVDHTADIGLKAYGKTLAEAFENAAKGMFDIITDNSEIDSIGQYNIEIESSDLKQLLVDWLSKLLFLNSSRNEIFGFFKINIDKKNIKLSSKVFGEKFNVLKHRAGSEIKAVTYHMLEVRNKKPFYVQILFDI